MSDLHLIESLKSDALAMIRRKKNILAIDQLEPLREIAEQPEKILKLLDRYCAGELDDPIDRAAACSAAAEIRKAMEG